MRRNKLLSQSSYKVVFLMRNWVALLCFLAGLLRFICGSFLHRSNQMSDVFSYVAVVRLEILASDQPVASVCNVRPAFYFGSRGATQRQL